MGKKTIYFIPGTMCDQRLWQPMWQLLEQAAPQRYNLVHLTISTEPAMMDVVATLADQIVENNSLVVGFSLGGYLASALAVRFPDKVGQLLVVSNLPRELPKQEITQRKRTIAWISKHGYSGIPTKRINDLLHSSMHHNLAIHQTISLMDQALGVQVLMHQLQVSMARPCLLPALTALATSVTFMVGENDALVDLSVLTAFADEYNNINLTKIADTGHMLPLEQPAALAQMIKSLD